MIRFILVAFLLTCLSNSLISQSMDQYFRHPLLEDVSNTPILRSYSLYNQVNTYNLLFMDNVLLSLNPGMDKGIIQEYRKLAGELKETIQSKFKNTAGNFNSGFELPVDGSEKWISYGKDCDYTECDFSCQYACNDICVIAFRENSIGK